MPKFKNKKTKEIVEENLIYYVDKLRNNSNYEEIKEEQLNENSSKSKKKEEVVNTPQ